MPDPTQQDIKTTPLHARHLALGARMMPFAGFDMPVQYSGIIDEHKTVRESAGMFDVSHMGEVLVTGPNAFDFVQQLVTNDASKLYDGRAMYSAMCRHDGGILDDLIVYRVKDDHYFIVVNASNISSDFDWMTNNNPMHADLTNVSDDMALIAIQGPRAFDIIQPLTTHDLDNLAFYHFVEAGRGEFLGCETAFLSHTGYTGERGLEIYCENASAGRVWDTLLDRGAALGLKPAGLGARDTLRLESGYCLYGNDITVETNPIEAGLGWVTKLDKGGFVGREALQLIKTSGPARKLIGFVVLDRGIPRHGYPVFDGDDIDVGIVTSGTQSPLLGQGIGLAYVANEPSLTTPGSTIQIGVRDRRLRAEVRKPPFHK
jgi:aminomethyltransferase